jgi:hypothetical protein
LRRWWHIRPAATIGRAHRAERETQKASGLQGTHPVALHHSKDLALTRVQLGHQVRGTGHTILQLERLERSTRRCCPLHGSLEVDSLTRAQAREVPAFAVVFTTVIDREPERTQQVVFIRDTAPRHDDGRDRVVHDLHLRGRGNAPRLAATMQLPNQLRSTPLQLRRSLLGRPSRSPTPRGDEGPGTHCLPHCLRDEPDDLRRALGITFAHLVQRVGEQAQRVLGALELVWVELLPRTQCG